MRGAASFVASCHVIAFLVSACGSGARTPTSTPGDRPATSQPAGSAAPSASAATGAAPTITAISGEVQGRELTISSAVFLYRDKADDLTIVLSDATGLCNALVAGALPKGARVLMVTLKLNTPENRDGPFRAGRYALRVPNVERQAQDAKKATFLALDESCTPLVQANATAGSVTLTTAVVREDGDAAGELDLTFAEGGSLMGRFVATHCKAEEEPRGCQ